MDFEYEILYAYSIGCKTSDEAEKWVEDNDIYCHCYETYEIEFDTWIKIARSLLPFTDISKSEITDKIRVGYASHKECMYIVHKYVDE